MTYLVGCLLNFLQSGSFCVAASSGNLAKGTMFDDFYDLPLLVVASQFKMLSQRQPIWL